MIVFALADASAGDDPIVTAEPGEGVTVSTERLSMTLRGRVRLRDELVVADDVTNALAVKAARVVLSGHVLEEELRYNVQLGLAPADLGDPPSPLLDAWLQWDAARDLSIRAGQHVLPFDRARTVTGWGLSLAARAPWVAELGLDRDVGLTLLSDDLFGAGALGYRLGVYGGEGRNPTAPGSLGLLYLARVEVKPLGDVDAAAEGDLARSPEPRLLIGLATAFNHEATRARSTTGPELDDPTDLRHAAADLTLAWRGLYVFAEAILRKGGDRSGWGALGHAGLMVTERDELVVRYARLGSLGTDPELASWAADRPNELALGVSHYVNGHRLKVQLDAAHAFASIGDGPLAVRGVLDATF